MPDYHKLKREAHWDNQLCRFWGPYLRLHATRIDGAITRFLRFSGSNLGKLVTPICSFVLTGHSTYIVLSQFVTGDIMRRPVLQI